jgi:hypothetical protein
MKDNYGRNIDYLRISITDRCNLRCLYCMPEEGVCKKRHEELLTQEEMLQAVRAAASLGITKLRITGGEPLVKPNIVELCRGAAATEGIREVCLTTNGTLLPQLAVPLREAAAHDGDSKAPSPVRHRSSSRSFGSLGIAGKGLGRVGTEKHLRQHGKVGPCLRCLTDHRLRRQEGRLPVGPGFDLAQSKSSRSHGSASHAILLPLSHKDRKKASIKNTKFRLFQRKCG